MQDLQESEDGQDELAVRVQQLKAELVLFKGLMSSVSGGSPAVNLLLFYGLHTMAPFSFLLKGNVA